MFDKLIESNSAEAEFKPRRKFFMVSTFIVGILFLSAVIASLYAQNFDLGNDEFEMSELLAPITADIPEPEPPRQPQPANQPQTSDMITRRTNMATVNETRHVPITISTTPNTNLARSTDPFIFDPNAIDSNGPGGPIGPVGSGTPGTSSSSSETAVAEVLEKRPPPIIKPAVVKPPTQSLGVVNGIAKYLPKPPYPKPAQMVNAEGAVNVQVTIDESGNVISSRAVTGHPLLRGAAEKAAKEAKFTPTYLSRVPVKVTGVIVYKFTRN